MRQFDEFLRQGLMGANLAQYRTVLEKVPDWEPDYSPKYRREQTRLLADPWGWMERRAGRRRARLDWRLIAVIAALLLLSACAYAVFTGQFSRWFPMRGVDPNAPETSEEVLSGTGTVIGQSVTRGDETVTLNAAVWDGEQVYLSLLLEGPHIPEDDRQFPPDSKDSWLTLRQDQWEAYTRNMLGRFYRDTEPELSPEQLEEAVQADLDRRDPALSTDFFSLGREGNTLTLEITAPLSYQLFPETEEPEVTLHLENIAACGDGGDSGDGSSREPTAGETILKGPVTFTFTLERPALSPSIRYDGAGAELPALEIPYRFTGFEVSTKSLTAFYAAQDPKELPGPGEIFTLTDSLWGLWTEDGTYVDIRSMGGGADGTSVSRDYPYPIDPAAVTAVDVAGTRVELGGLKRLDP